MAVADCTAKAGVLDEGGLYSVICPSLLKCWSFSALYMFIFMFPSLSLLSYYKHEAEMMHLLSL